MTQNVSSQHDPLCGTFRTTLSLRHYMYESRQERSFTRVVPHISEGNDESERHTHAHDITPRCPTISHSQMSVAPDGVHGRLDRGQCTVDREGVSLLPRARRYFISSGIPASVRDEFAAPVVSPHRSNGAHDGALAAVSRSRVSRKLALQNVEEAIPPPTQLPMGRRSA